MTRAGHDSRKKEGAAACSGRECGVGSRARKGKGRGSSCGSDNRDNCGSRGDNIKLLNHGSDSRRNSAYRLMGYSGNSVNNDNLNRTDAADSYIPIPLALIAFSNDANLENFLFGTFISIIYLDVFVINIIPQWGY